MNNKGISQFFHANVRRMSARDEHEAHRASTPLELLFDLVAVIAIAAAASELHHAIAHGHALEGAGKFVLAFFAIWWAWMNFTWFASAYDNDDAIFRILTMGLMAGSLTLSAGIAPFFQHNDLTLIVIGFVWMRICMVFLWLRASNHHAELKRTTRTYAVGLMLVQSYWVALALLQPLNLTPLMALFALGAGFELAVPAIAESKGVTPWHRHHMIERYGLLNLIVLGETLLAASMAIGKLQQIADSSLGMVSMLQLMLVPVMSLVLLFSLWWLYFSREEHLAQKDFKMAFTWGYGHLLIYAAGAAVGAGIAVHVDALLGDQHIASAIVSAGVAIPVAIYLLGLWLVRDRFLFRGVGRYLLLCFAVVIPLISAISAQISPLAALIAIALLTLLAVILRSSHVCCQLNQLSSSEHSHE